MALPLFEFFACSETWPRPENPETIQHQEINLTMKYVVLYVYFHTYTLKVVTILTKGDCGVLDTLKRSMALVLDFMYTYSM